MTLERKIKKFIKEHNSSSDGPKAKPASVEDINVKTETLENLTLDEVMKRAEKAQSSSTSKNKAAVDPMEKVVIFLQQEQKMIEKRE